MESKDMSKEEAKHMAEREKKQQAKNEGIDINTNKQPVNTEGRVTGSNAMLSNQLAQLMARQQFGASKKSNNFK